MLFAGRISIRAPALTLSCLAVRLLLLDQVKVAVDFGREPLSLRRRHPEADVAAADGALPAEAARGGAAEAGLE